MVNLLRTSGRLTGAILLVGASVWAAAPTAQPGVVNYTEGQVFVDGQALQASQSAQVQPGQTLSTQNGKAEMLLTPGVFLRLNNNSQARLDANSITDTRVALVKGEAMIEADQVIKDNGIQIIDAGFSSHIDKPGIYEFNVDQPMVRVYDGEATVSNDDRTVNVKKGHELAFVPANAKLKTQGFDTKMTDPLYSWSRVRSEYMAEANMATAQTIVVNNPGWYYGTGWYWNPYWASWAFVPGAGYWGSPFGFGFGFYSPVVWSTYRPYFGYRGFAGVPAYRGAAPAFRGATPAVRSTAPSFARGTGFGPGFAGHFAGGGHVGGGGRR